MPMCFSPCFIHATQGAFVQHQLLQCRTCGSQAFHILDCCRNPDYIRVPTSRLGERLRGCLGSVKAIVQAWLRRAPQPPQRPQPSEVLDAWEARPLVTINAGDTPARRQAGADGAMEEVEHELASIHR
jgi:hypothetical protein